MRASDTNPNRLNVFGDGMMGKLSARSRKRRKRSASKKRRHLLKDLGKLDR
jgi:hypothetical protein